jgi:hypothetical protein
MRDCDGGEIGGSDMIRRLFTFTSVASLLLSIGTAVMCGRPGLVFKFKRQTTQWEAVAADGVFSISNRPQVEADESARHAALVAHLNELMFYTFDDAESWYPDVETRRENERAAIQTILSSSRTAPRNYSVHGWGVIALLLLVPLSLRATMVLHARYLRRRRICLVCGYDLRATPDRCPECGTPIAQTMGMQ